MVSLQRLTQAFNAPRQRPRCVLLLAGEQHLEPGGVHLLTHHGVRGVDHALGIREGGVPLRLARDMVAVREDCL